MLRILMSAYACEPERGSEPGVGWNWVLQAARFNEVWVLTRSNNRRSIEAANATNALKNVTFVYFDLPKWARSWKKGSFGVRLYYILWQLCAYRIATRLHREVRFDLVHHVTFVNYWLPSALPLMPLPFIWGPVGGGEAAPDTFRSSFGLKGKLGETMRDIAQRMVSVEPLSRLTARRAACTFATTSETEVKLRSLGCQRLSVLSQVALSEDDIEQLVLLPSHNHRPFRVLSIGRFIHWKGFELGLRAFANFHQQFPASEYWLVGDGPERLRLEHLARTLNVSDCVRFLGSMSRDQAWATLENCSVLVHPSLHESGGYVCIEAMAAGRPVVCLDLGGPALQVTPETGIKVPAADPNQVVFDLSAALRRLAEDPCLCTRMGEAAQARVAQHFTWNQKGETLKRIYDLVRNGSSAW